MNDLEKKDYQKYFVKSPKDFSPERNRYIINKTIEEYEAGLKKKRKKKEDALMERIDATASYLMHLERTGNTAERYFGKKELARLRGKSIIETMLDEKRKMIGLSEVNDYDFVY